MLLFNKTRHVEIVMLGYLNDDKLIRQHPNTFILDNIAGGGVIGMRLHFITYTVRAREQVNTHDIAPLSDSVNAWDAY